jgi:hypothetical protein
LALPSVGVVQLFLFLVSSHLDLQRFVHLVSQPVRFDKSFYLWRKSEVVT